MNILLVSQYFYPENFKGNDIAFELQRRGYQVTVLTGIPNYPEGKFYKGYGYFNKRRETIDGVRVIRTFLIPRGKGTKIPLFLNYFSWFICASFVAFYLSITKRFDKIIVQQLSPITIGIPAIVVKKIQKTPIFFWILDLWPESLKTAGGVNNKYILGFFETITKYLYKNSDKLLVSSDGFKEAINTKGDFTNKLISFPNWAEDTIANGQIDFPIPNLPDGFKIIFAGNIGESQDMESILEAANQLKSNSNIKFLIIGEGRKMPFVLNFIKEKQLSETVKVLGRYPVEAMATFFHKADLLLVSLKNDTIFNLTVPAKVQAYMSVGKPILAMLNGEGAKVIEKANCGFTVPASDNKQLAKTIEYAFNLDKKTLLEKGSNGKLFFKNNYKLSTCIDNLEKILKLR